MKPFDPNMIRALTPIFIAFVGGAIALSVLYTNANSAGFSIATSAIAAAAGLAQPGKDLNSKS